jgi:hypothetical protein
MGSISQEGNVNLRGPKSYSINIGKVTIGSSGAIASQVYDSMKSAPTFTYSTTGTYTIAGLPATILEHLDFSVYSPALTVIDIVVTARDTAAGTATIKTLNASGAATNMASGDYFTWKLVAR